jgi:hypothetical protein
MGPLNVIVSATTPTDIMAIIDWEFVASAPCASLHRVIEMPFRRLAANGLGEEYAHADELRDAFWGAMPEWRARNESRSTNVFLKRFHIGVFMEAD